MILSVKEKTYRTFLLIQYHRYHTRIWNDAVDIQGPADVILPHTPI